MLLEFSFPPLLTQSYLYVKKSTLPHLYPHPRLTPHKTWVRRQLAPSKLALSKLAPSKLAPRQLSSRQLAPWTARHMDSSPHRQFAPRTVRPTDNSPYGQLAPRTTHPTDNSPHGQLAPWWVTWLFWWVPPPARLYHTHTMYVQCQKKFWKFVIIICYLSLSKDSSRLMMWTYNNPLKIILEFFLTVSFQIFLQVFRYKLQYSLTQCSGKRYCL
jgi:hypothetical protein